ncbi:serine/threonine-protein kinase [Nocardia caishijiensis]|uniref:non-specific serine/threonine protein kinase n=1 Tax=Nocardia caishijiensis TaxID=184756 RepID=A0ABQ6YPS5_9NOCA|nr:serine/threonine protein kinase [Nocardia caishijiensis]
MVSDGTVFAGYTIDRQLGRGGMGSVYLARHPRLPRWTALKLLNQELFSDAEIRARFEREADLVAQLDHPNIVTVFDRGVENDQLWISMQYIDGIDASMLDPTTLPPDRALQIIRETAAALDFAHRAGVLHRDVKPANILLARSNSQERVYLTDFGIARLRDDSGHLTETGSFTATLAYAAPEQLTGVPLDHRADQYSLACTLYTLLTGTAPFEAPSPAAVITGHLQSPPPPVSPRRAGLPPNLDAVMARALSKRPADRFTSCEEFVEAAQRALRTGTTGARPIARPPSGAHAQPFVGMQPMRPVNTSGAAIPRPPVPQMAPRPATPAAWAQPAMRAPMPPPPPPAGGGWGSMVGVLLVVFAIVIGIAVLIAVLSNL